MSIHEIIVQNNNIRIMNVNGVDYISLTDLAKYVEDSEPNDIIKKWMSNKDSVLYYGLWEELNNHDFNSAEFSRIKNGDLGTNRFVMTPTKWNRLTNSKGIIPSSGRYSIGTFAHPDIAFEFASWLSPEFKLYLIKEFERLKEKEMKDIDIKWNVARLFTKINYSIQTDTINKYIIPTLNEEQKKKVYGDEADVLNVALFGMTAGEWRLKNKELPKETNIRDYANLIQLIILNNLEIANSEYIKLGINQRERLIKLNESARNQLEVIIKNEALVNHDNNSIYLLDK